MIEERLLICLRDRASDRGIVPVRGDILSQEVEASPEEVGAALDKLERAGLLKILAPFPFLVLKLTSWSGDSQTPATATPAAYSYSKLSNKHASESHRPTGDDALLREILDTLGET